MKSWKGPYMFVLQLQWSFFRFDSTRQFAPESHKKYFRMRTGGVRRVILKSLYVWTAYRVQDLDSPTVVIKQSRHIYQATQVHITRICIRSARVVLRHYPFEHRGVYFLASKYRKLSESISGWAHISEPRI